MVFRFWMCPNPALTLKARFGHALKLKILDVVLFLSVLYFFDKLLYFYASFYTFREPGATTGTKKYEKLA